MFELAGGTVVGKDHYRDKGNNQDSYCFKSTGDVMAAFVCDGCGDKTNCGNSEIGAQIGSRMLMEQVIKTALKCLTNPEFLKTDSIYFWEQIRREVLKNIYYLASQMGENSFEVITKYFLFTVVGVLITPEWTEFVSIGDGVIIVNDEIIRIGPYPNNAPPYLTYAWMPTSIDQKLLNFQIHRSMPTKELESFLLGCDGVVDLIEAENLIIPTTEEVVGPVNQFWQNDLYFKNPFSINRRLTIINRERQNISSDGVVNVRRGLLHDDTTLVVGRKRKED